MLLFSSSWAVSSLAFNYVYWGVSVRAEYTCVSPLTHTSSLTVKHERRSSGRIGARSIVRSFGFSCYPIEKSYNNTSFNCKTIYEPFLMFMNVLSLLFLRNCERGFLSNSCMVAKQRQRQLRFIKLPFKNRILLLQVDKTLYDFCTMYLCSYLVLKKNVVCIRSRLTWWWIVCMSIILKRFDVTTKTRETNARHQ